MTSDNFRHENLISQRAAGRVRVHFATLPTKGKPEGFKPHPNPLHFNWGMPNDGFFPIESLEVTVAEAPFQNSLNLAHTNNSLEALNSKELNSAFKKLDIDVSKSANKVVINKRNDDKSLVDLRQGLQYSLSSGLPQLLKFTKEFVEATHKPAFEDWDVTLSTGAGDGLLKATDVFLDPGDVILLEEFTFTPVLMMIKEAGGIAVPVKLNVDAKSEGLDVDYLANLLENWDELQPELKGKRPKALYTIPTGHNPTGFTSTIAHRKKVYALAEKYDFGIIEDDPYGYLTLPPYKKPQGLTSLDDFITKEEFVKDHLTPSYLEIDTSGRVLRVETFSKLFAPGLRVGFLVGHKRLIEVINNYSGVVTKFPSGASQTILQNIVQQKFGGVDGWISWILKMRATYIHRRDVMLGSIFESNAYKKGYLDVLDPKAGMFVSVFIKFPEGTDIQEKIDLLNWKFEAYGVQTVPGLNMAVDPKFSLERGNFFRLTYAPLNNTQEIVEGCHRLTSAVEDFFDKGLEF